MKADALNLSSRSSRPPAGSQRSRPRSFSTQPVAWLVLAIALLATSSGWYISRMHAELTARKQFDEETRRVTAALSERMQVYQGLLQGAVGLFAASESVERGEWRAYTQTVSVEGKFPGVDGIGYVARVPRGRLEEFLKKTRADDAPDFAVQRYGTNTEPATHPELCLITYLEPMDRHRQSLGRDIAEESERMEVARKARDTGAAAISGRIELRQQDDNLVPGFLMMLPVYERGASLQTTAERAEHLVGWVYARFVTDNLLRGILDNRSTGVQLRVYDGTTTNAAMEIFNSHRNDGAVGFQSRFVDTTPIVISGRIWTLEFASEPAFEASIPWLFSTVVGIGGGLISLLLFGIAWSLSQTRTRAVALASDMTAALRETNERLKGEVAERKLAEQAIKDSEALYHSLVESLPLNIVRKDLHDRVTFANQRFCNELGRSREQIIGRTELDLFPPDLAEKHRLEDRQVFQTGNTLETVEETHDDRGATRYLQVIKTPVRDGTGAIVGLLGIFWDVTDKRHAEEELKHERYLLRTLMNNLPDRIYFKDIESRFMRVSRAMFARRGLTDSNQILGKTDFDFFTDEHAMQAYRDEQEVIESGHPINKEEKETWPDGSVTWALTTKMPLRDASGKIIGTFGISHDITDRKHAEDALQLAKDAAEAANRTKSQFLANMSHELRTPLNSVIGFANILLKNKAHNLRPEDITFLERIVANGRHLLGLINEILDLSKIEARRVEVQLASVSLAALVQEVIDELEGQTRGRDVKLVADLPPMMVTFDTDPVKLKQVIINLIGNALKFTEQGSVTVRVSVEPRTRQPNRIDVIDTGIGISPDRLTAVFEAFQQADSSTARKYGGTGLGLTISKALCELMGYQIEVSSQVGTGSKFSIIIPVTESVEESARGVSIPASAAPVAVGAAGLSDSEAPDGNKLVLVVDDEADSRILLTNLIEECGCRVITVESGEQALRRAAETHPDLILLDLMMPNMDGWQVMQALKADPQLQDIPVVVTSIVASENRGTLLGAVDVLQKPVTREEILRVLKRFPRPKVLIVEDSELDRRVMIESLQAGAAELRAASDGREALEQLESFSPEVIVLDLMMPQMDGMTFLARLRADKRFEHTPVFVVTSRTLSPDEKQRLASQAQSVLTKSESWGEDLRRLLRALLHPDTSAETRPEAAEPSSAPAPNTPTKELAMSDSKELDEEALARLHRLGRNAKFVGDMIDLFLGYAPEKVAAARTALNAGDLRAVALAVHPLKSGAGNVGARVVQDLATRIEKLSQDGQRDDLPDLLLELDAALTRVRILLTEARSKFIES